MCGIAGIAQRAAAPDRLPGLRHMIAALRHRGPDDEGCVSVTRADGSPAGVFLGNTRLAILDCTSAGHQPMRDERTGNWLVLNGEIYNHLELRAALADKVERWRSGSDTETVLQAFAAWGIGCLARLRGMFALALWDAATNTLWCARDRFGIKPFYLSQQPEAFSFASEVRALLAGNLVQRQLDWNGLAGYVRFGSVPEPRTLVRGVSSLPAGHYARVVDGAVREVTPYCDPTTLDLSVREHPERIRQLLEHAVREHLLSDVPVACFLSGGIDSSIITALAAKQSPAPLRTFTVAFREAEFDESEYARQIANRYGTVHERIVLSAGQIAAQIPDGVAAMDLPSADGLNTYVVSRAVAQQGIKVVLSGLGGDELFGGYPTFRVLPYARQFAPLLGSLPAWMRRVLPGGRRAVQLTRRGMSLRDRYETLRAFWSDSEIRGFGLRVLGYGGRDPGAPLATLSRISMLELTGYMKSTLLRDGDAMSMAHSLEMRVPFLDHELVQACLRAGAAGPGRKNLLLRLSRDLLPKEITTRPKQGFVLPLALWMEGPLRPFVADALSQIAASRALPGIDFEDLRERFSRGRLNYARVWQFVVLGDWLRRHRMQPVSEWLPVREEPAQA